MPVQTVLLFSFFLDDSDTVCSAVFTIGRLGAGEESFVKNPPEDKSTVMQYIAILQWDLYFSIAIHSALCGYPIVKMEIRDSSQISTTAPIFLLYNYFRQKYLEITSCAVSLLNNIWVRVEHILMQQLNLQKKSIAFQAVCRQEVNKIVGTSWTPASKHHQIFYMMKKSRKIFVYFKSHFHNVPGPC